MLKRLDVETAVEALSNGGLVVFPTETSYGLGCKAFDAHAVDRLVRAKGRPDGKPLPILVPSLEYFRARSFEHPLFGFAEIFWPGALTLVVPAFPGLPEPVTAGTNMVGVRLSAHPVANALVESLGEPIVGTSANLSGRPAPCSLEECDTTGLDGIAGVLDGGTTGGAGSTVVGLVGGDLKIFRQGPVSEATLRAEWSRMRQS